MSEENKFYDNYTEEPEVVDTQITEEEPVYYGEPEMNQPTKGTGKGAGIASLICGIIALVGCCGAWYVGIPCGIAAVICGIIQCKKKQSKGLAIAGIICGAIGIVLSIVILIAVVVLMNSGMYEQMWEEIMYEFY